MAVRIQPDFSANQGINPQRIEASGIADARDKYFKFQASAKPGNFDNEGKAAYTDPFDLQADGSYQMNAWTAGNNEGSNAFEEVEMVDGSKKRVPSWQAQSMFYNEQGLRNFGVLSDRLEKLQGSGLATIKDLINQAYSKIG